LCDVFEGPFPWWEFPEYFKRKSKYFVALEARIRPNETEHFSLVVESGRDLVGFAEVGWIPAPRIPNRSISPDIPLPSYSNEMPDSAFIGNLCVAQRFRGQGIGKELVRLSTEWVRSRGQDSVFISVATTNTQARQLYEDMAFQILPSQDGNKKLYYMKQLT
jgi:ribosomal protein S18 acetylase RimI-like enzyme